MENKIERAIEIDKKICELREFINLSELGYSVQLNGRTFTERLNQYIILSLKDKLDKLNIEYKELISG